MAASDIGSSVTAVESGCDDTPDISDSDGKSSLIKRRFTSPWSQKRGDKDDEGSHGPIGLRLLHYSPEPLIDLIFVHGLRGGSIKTWRKGNDRGRFWPQYWLPLEPGFENVNIHTFGYDSDWANFKSSILGVHDFGQGLLEEMRNAPYLRDDGEVRIYAHLSLCPSRWHPIMRAYEKQRPIILIGHSMGGLIIKKVGTPVILLLISSILTSLSMPGVHPCSKCIGFQESDSSCVFLSYSPTWLRLCFYTQ